MGEVRLSRTRGDELVAIGLGSCIGLVLVDPAQRVAGLAHIVLPDSSGGGAASPAKFADTGVPHLLAELVKLGGRRTSTHAVLVGGAAMFALREGRSGATLDIGARNQAAVRTALARESITVVAHATGGSVGRTVRVDVAEAIVTVKEASGETFELWRNGARAAASVR